MKKETLKERVARRVFCGALVLMGMTGFGVVALAASVPAADIAAPVQDGVTKSGGASATTETQIACYPCPVTGVRG